MKQCLILLAALPLILTSPDLASAQLKKEALADKVRSAIDRGVTFLRSQQDKSNGAWEMAILREGHNGGSTALVVLALLNSGAKANDPAVKKGLEYLTTIKKPSTYVRALQTMAFSEYSLAAGREELKFQKVYLETIQKNVDHLLKIRVHQDGKLTGWSYDLGVGSGKPDNSNSQYAMLGLYAGQLAGATIKPEIWEEIRAFYKASQNEDGGWGYEANGIGPFGRTSKMSMTTAGLCGLLISGMELNPSREVLHKNGPAENCGLYQEDISIRKGLDWISNPRIDRFQLEVQHGTFYNLYGIERAGRLSGLRFFHAHDWYREGCEFLVKNQQPDGSWFLGWKWDTKEYQYLNTSFALLFLSKGRTPVLISKLAHGPAPRTRNDQDWNNDRNDLRHLVEHASKELFKRQPLAWQTFDMLRAIENQQGVAAVLTAEDQAEITSELLQSPIAYITGHKTPDGRFTEQEKDLLKKYVESGGFILAEACCGSKVFDRGFQDLVRDIWDQDLEDLPADHPVWSIYARVKPGSFGLKGLRMGCKWVMIYSPKDLSCRWETGKPEDPQCVEAFKLGLNIIAYATGNEPPRPRLTHVEVAVVKDDPAEIPPGVLKVGQLNHGGDWKLAPRAMSNVMVHLHKKFGVDVATKWEEVNFGTKKAIDYKFIYMHGRNAFKSEGDLKELRFNLETGGLLFADACCGSKKFDESFRAFLKDLLPKHKLEKIPPGDRLFSKDLNGTALTKANIRGRQAKQGPMEDMLPQLEGIKIDNRWVVIYSPLDIGCALERHQSPECPGYTTESAMRIATAAVLYQLMPDLKGQ